jgi:hypothetical protein
LFENRVLFRPKRVEVAREWRNLQTGELHNLYSSPNIITQIKTRRMRRAWQVARMGEERKVCKVLVVKLEGKRPLGDQGVHGRMGSGRILGRLARGVERIQLVHYRYTLCNKNKAVEI